MPDFDSVRVNKIRIENTFGIRKLEFNPDGVARIQGDNDTGKTSVLKAIFQLLSGGQNEEALRKGADDGEVRFHLDDGTEVWASITQNRIYYKTNKEDATGREVIESLYNEISVNPVQILDARPQDRGQILLEAMPMTVSRKDVEDYLSPFPELYRSMDWAHMEEQHALEVLGDKSSGLIGTLYDKRQELHGAKRDKEGMVNTLEESLGDLSKGLEELKEDRKFILKGLENMRQKKKDELEEVNSWEKKKIEEIKEEAKNRREQVREDYDDEIRETEAKRERLNEKIQQAERQEQTLENLEERKEELEQMEEKYDTLTESIEGLRSLRIDFSEDLPGGVTLADDGEIVDEDGIRFEHWNEQSKMSFIMRLADRHKGPLGLIPLDGIENIVGEQRRELLRYASESDAQFIMTEAVPGMDLTVTTEEDSPNHVV